MNRPLIVSSFCFPRYLVPFSSCVPLQGEAEKVRVDLFSLLYLQAGEPSLPYYAGPSGHPVFSQPGSPSCLPFKRVGPFLRVTEKRSLPPLLFFRGDVLGRTSIPSFPFPHTRLRSFGRNHFPASGFFVGPTVPSLVSSFKCAYFFWKETSYSRAPFPRHGSHSSPPCLFPLPRAILPRLHSPDDRVFPFSFRWKPFFEVFASRREAAALEFVFFSQESLPFFLALPHDGPLFSPLLRSCRC